MILTDKRILEEIEKGNIVIEPFDRKFLGSNSYDVHLADIMSIYKDDILDARKHNKLNSFKINDDGFLLLPGRLYLAVTQEYTETHTFVPFLEGKSSIGRLGIDMDSRDKCETAGQDLSRDADRTAHLFRSQRRSSRALQQKEDGKVQP